MSYNKVCKLLLHTNMKLFHVRHGVPDDNCVQYGVTCCFPLQILAFKTWRKNIVQNINYHDNV